MSRILAISGSLRSQSSNSTLLRAAASLAPAGISIDVYTGLGGLPHFNPDLEGAEPQTVLEYRRQLQTSQGVLISSPEYAHGVPGVLKNALDWVVGSGELVDKPVALLNASPRSTYAMASLRETITVMSAKIIEDATVTVPLPRRDMDEESIIADAAVSGILREALTAFAHAIRAGAGTA
jgi:chromate reductase, NAD(P)H dehydrogenase (quinone)